MARSLFLAALLSSFLLATQEASAKAPHHPRHPPRQAMVPGVNQAPQGGYGFGWSPFWGAPAYGPVMGYMPVYGMGATGFVGNYGGGGGYATTFVTPSFGGQNGFGGGNYGHWGGFSK
ncbi:MAG TPA: hypothetical protein VF278_13865 [Pirellulales bacterium]